MPPFKPANTYGNSTEASLDMIHNHLAKRPADPRVHLPDHLSTPSSSSPPSFPSSPQSVFLTRCYVIQLFSHIILKLLTKIPEDRYQSAAGLKSDLEHCLAILQGLFL